MRIADAGRSDLLRTNLPSPGAPTSATRRPTNVILPDALLSEARALGINLNQACERGLAAGVGSVRRQRWLEENQAAMDAWNEHVAEHGLPLDAYRQF